MIQDGQLDILEQCSLTGGRHNSFAMSVFLIFPASSKVKPFTRSVIYELEAIALPQPNVLNLTSEIIPLSSTRIWSFMTSPHLEQHPFSSAREKVGKTIKYSRRCSYETRTNIDVILWKRANLKCEEQVIR
jgi:hypothetical protein